MTKGLRMVPNWRASFVVVALGVASATALSAAAAVSAVPSPAGAKARPSGRSVGEASHRDDGDRTIWTSQVDVPGKVYYYSSLLGDMAVDPDGEWIVVTAPMDASSSNKPLVRALDTSTGDVIWEYPLGPTDNDVWDVETDPAGSSVYLATSGGSNIVALDADTGAERWRADDTGPSAAIGHRIISDGSTVWLSTVEWSSLAGTGSLDAMDALTGAPLWHVDGVANIAMSESHDRLFTVGLWPRGDAGALTVAALEPDSGSTLWKRRLVQEPQHPVEGWYRMGLQVGPAGLVVHSSPGSGGLALTMLSVNDGELRWSQHVRIVSAPIVLADADHVYVSGSGAGARRGPDYLTVAYSSSTGDRIWGQWWNGDYDGGDYRDDQDMLYDAALSSDGRRIYATGVVNKNPGCEDDFVCASSWGTIARSTQSGKVIWKERLTGWGNYDQAVAIEADPNRRAVFVAGVNEEYSRAVAYRG